MGSELTSAYAHCDAFVREHDKDRYIAALFAPADKRPHLNALYALSAEISPSFTARCSNSQEASCIRRVVTRMLSVA